MGRYGENHRHDSEERERNFLNLPRRLVNIHSIHSLPLAVQTVPNTTNKLSKARRLQVKRPIFRNSHSIDSLSTENANKISLVTRTTPIRAPVYQLWPPEEWENWIKDEITDVFCVTLRYDLVYAFICDHTCMISWLLYWHNGIPADSAGDTRRC